MRHAAKTLVLLAAIVLVAAPRQARAEGYVSPWVGANWGSNVSNGRAAFGLTAGGMGGGIFGGELNFGYSPSFFGTQNDFGHNSVIDLMGNVIVGVPIGGDRVAAVKPFVTAGAGLVRTQIDGGSVVHVSSANNQWGWSAGGGVMGYFNDHVGLRGDIRFVDGKQINFWRVSGGIVLR